MSIKCSNHRNADAIGQCARCKIPICEVCNVSEDEGLMMCEACAMLSTFSSMSKRKEIIDEKRTHKELESSSKKMRRRSLILTALVAIALIIVAAEVIWYFSLTNVKVDRFNPYEDYLATTIKINDAIVRYRADHEGEAPDSLEVLLGVYLPESDVWKRGIKAFYYNKINPFKYELMPPLKSDDIPDIVFSDEGPEIVGM